MTTLDIGTSFDCLVGWLVTCMTGRQKLADSSAPLQSNNQRLCEQHDTLSSPLAHSFAKAILPSLFRFASGPTESTNALNSASTTLLTRSSVPSTHSRR